ncbi:MAG: HEPN domain-containing protein [Nitrospirae bacterium]|nr:MAG: HEPN domain-containing protein [Nitrospirota bacterium]
MTLSRDDKITLSNVRMEKAREFLQDAKANLKEGRFRTSVNRCYYAALNAARALLILEGVNPSSHEGVVTMLSLRFVKPGLLDVQFVKDYKILMARRTDVDYGDFDVVSGPEAEDTLTLTERFVENIDNLRKKLLKEL